MNSLKKLGKVSL